MRKEHAKAVKTLKDAHIKETMKWVKEKKSLEKNEEAAEDKVRKVEEAEKEKNDLITKHEVDDKKHLCACKRSYTATTRHAHVHACTKHIKKHTNHTHVQTH